MTFLEKVKYLRENHKYTMEYVANVLNISKSSYSRKENGQTDFTLPERDKLLNLYKLSDADFAQSVPPVVLEISYPDGALDSLKKLLQDISNNFPSDWNSTKAALDSLQSAMEPIEKARSEAFRSPDIGYDNLESMKNGDTIKSVVNVNLYEERLLNEALELSNKLYSNLFRTARTDADMDVINSYI